MKEAVPTITETDEAIIIRIPKGWVRDPHRNLLTPAHILRIVETGEREFRAGKTREFSAFLAQRYPAYARRFPRAR